MDVTGKRYYASNKHKLQAEDTVTHMKMKTFGRMQRQQATDLSNHTWTPSTSHVLVNSSRHDKCLKLEKSLRNQQTNWQMINIALVIKVHYSTL